MECNRNVLWICQLKLFFEDFNSPPHILTFPGIIIVTFIQICVFPVLSILLCLMAWNFSFSAYLGNCSYCVKQNWSYCYMLSQQKASSYLCCPVFYRFFFFDSSDIVYVFMNDVTYSDVFAPNTVFLLR